MSWQKLPVAGHLDRGKGKASAHPDASKDPKVPQVPHKHKRVTFSEDRAGSSTSGSEPLETYPANNQRLIFSTLLAPASIEDLVGSKRRRIVKPLRPILKVEYGCQDFGELRAQAAREAALASRQARFMPPIFSLGKHYQGEYNSPTAMRREDYEKWLLRRPQLDKYEALVKRRLGLDLRLVRAGYIIDADAPLGWYFNKDDQWVRTTVGSYDRKIASNGEHNMQYFRLVYPEEKHPAWEIVGGSEAYKRFYNSRFWWLAELPTPEEEELLLVDEEGELTEPED